MKPYSLALIFFFSSILCSLSLSAQDGREDVVYLKNGSIYRGIIIEQVPGVSLKIETVGGNVFFVALADVAKFTKEKKEESAPDTHRADMHGEGYYRGETHGERHYEHYRYAKSDTHAKPHFQYRKRGYFNTVQLLVENLEGGGRLVNGYKFGRFGYLGIGIGMDFIFNDLSRNRSDYSGVYLPLYLHYGGDFFKKKITPFYSIEAGYSMRMNPNNIGSFPGGDPFNNNSGITNRKGGLMGGAALGVKFYSKHKVFFSISAHADFQQAGNTYNTYLYDPAGNYYLSTHKTHTTLLIPGIRFGLGF